MHSDLASFTRFWYFVLVSSRAHSSFGQLNEGMSGVRSDRVEILVDVLGNGLDLGAQLIFDLEHVMLVVFGNKVESETEMTESTRAAYPVEVGV